MIIKPVIHIGILDHTMFPDIPEFYAKYRFMNVKNHNVYNDKLALNVLDLKQIHLATPEDKQFDIDKWALLFKAITWEELKDMARQNEIFKEVTNTVFNLSADAQIQKRCRDREDYYADLRGMQETIDEQRQEIAEKQQEINDKQQEINDQQQEINDQRQKIALLEKQLAELQKEK